jgi:hypothetical protein
MLCVLAVLAPSAQAARKRGTAEGLIQAQVPSIDAHRVASAHPGVNVVVSFGTTTSGAPADPATFHARLGHDDVTGLFHTRDGAPATNRYATLPAAKLRIGHRPRNVLRLVVQAVRGAGTSGRAARDVDRLRFGAAESPNHAPIALVSASDDVVVPGTAIDFDATGTSDPDGDDLSYAWDFGDGATASGPSASHTFASTPATEVVVTLTASDGQTTGTASLRLPIVPTIDPDKTPGTLAVEMTAPLEFGGAAIGTTATRTLTLHNTDTTATSQVKVGLSSSDPAFAVDGATIVRGPDEAATADVTFTPSATGHQDARIRLVIAASNRHSVTFLAHGYGGVAPGSGPTLLAAPVYTPFPDLGGIMPDGTLFATDGTTGTCAAAGGGTGDVCVVDADCRSAGESCSGGASAFDTAELCSDGQSLYLLSNEGTFTDPDVNADPALASTVLRIDLDAAGHATGKKILDRTTENTSQLACDGVSAGQGGLVYLAEFRGLTDTATCPRDGREALVRINKSSGNTQVANGLSRLDSVATGDCDDLDPVQQLAVSADGSRLVAGFETNGLWRIRPSPLPLTPGVNQLFQMHPDGSIVFAAARDSGTNGMIDVYRLTDQQAEHGALPLAALQPCASFAVPNNAGAGVAKTIVSSVVAGPASTSSRDAVVLVSFVAGAPAPPHDVLPLGNVQGLVAFALPADATICTASGLVSLDAPFLER